MRALPRSLAGRLALVLLLALVAAQGIAVFLFAGERAAAVHHAYRENVVARTATVVRLIQGTPPALHDSVAAAARTRFVRYSLTPEPVVEHLGSGERAEAIARDLARALGVDRGRVRIAPLWRPHRHGEHDDDDDHDDDDHDDEHDDDDDDDHERPRWKRHWFAVSIAMPDDGWLNVQVGPPPGARPFGWTFLLSFALSALAVGGVAVWAARRLTRPMRRLADAADALGRGEDVGDLPEAGPLETRRTVRAFNRMRDRIDRFVRDRTTMLAAISHDLRTPIAGLRLQAEFVADEEVRKRIASGLDEMQRMTEETLAFAREDMTREETRTVDLRALVDSVAADLADLGHDVSLADGGRVLVRCRPAALRRAVANLLENAAVYGRRGRARIDRPEGDVRVAVDDEGPGIADADLERVFEPFVRLEGSRSRETGGSGLGLAIARTVVRGHGGDVRLENRKEGGLRATLTLPRAAVVEGGAA